MSKFVIDIPEGFLEKEVKKMAAGSSNRPTELEFHAFTETQDDIEPISIDDVLDGTKLVGLEYGTPTPTH